MKGAARRRPHPYTFICSGCECVEHRRHPVLPKGWTTREARGDIFAFCPDCGPPADHAGSQAALDRTATALDRAWLPLLFAAIGATGSAAVLAQLAKWIGAC